MFRRILLFDVNRILKWDVGRALRADVTAWRVPPILVKGFIGYFVAGLLMALIVPWAATRGWQVAPVFAWLLLGACVAAAAIASDRILGKNGAIRPRRK